MTHTHRSGEPIAIMRRRLLAAAAKGKTISYSRLAGGIKFDASWSPSGTPFEIDVAHWSSRDIRIVAVVLNAITESLRERHGFLISALVVSKKTGKPSEGFFRVATKAEMLDDNEDRDWFWERQLETIYEHYAPPAEKDADEEELSEQDRADRFPGGDE